MIRPQGVDHDEDQVRPIHQVGGHGRRGSNLGRYQVDRVLGHGAADANQSEQPQSGEGTRDRAQCTTEQLRTEEEEKERYGDEGQQDWNQNGGRRHLFGIDVTSQPEHRDREANRDRRGEQAE